MADYPKIAQLKSVAALRARFAELGLELPVDEAILTAEQGSPLAQPIAIGGFAVRQSLVHPSDGRLGREPRRLAERAHAAAVAEFWAQRGEADLGRRSGGRAARWPGESESDAGDRRRTARGLAALLDECLQRHIARRSARTDGSARRPAAHALRPLLQAERPQAARAADCLSSSAARCEVRHRAGRRLASSGPTTSWSGSIDALRRRGGACPRRRLSVRRREGLPRLLAARVSERPHAARANSAATSPAARALLLTIIDRIREEYPDLLVGVRLSVFDTLPYQDRAARIGQPMEYRAAAAVPVRLRRAAPSDPLQSRPDRADRAAAAA